MRLDGAALEAQQPSGGLRARDLAGYLGRVGDGELLPGEVQLLVDGGAVGHDHRDHLTARRRVVLLDAGAVAAVVLPQIPATVDGVAEADQLGFLLGVDGGDQHREGIGDRSADLVAGIVVVLGFRSGGVAQDADRRLWVEGRGSGVGFLSVVEPSAGRDRVPGERVADGEAVSALEGRGGSGHVVEGVREASGARVVGQTPVRGPGLPEPVELLGGGVVECVPGDELGVVQLWQDVADHRDGRCDLDALDGFDLVVLAHGDAAEDSGQEVLADQVIGCLQARCRAFGTHQDVVGGAVVAVDGSLDCETRRGHRGREQAERHGCHDDRGDDSEAAGAAACDLVEG